MMLETHDAWTLAHDAALGAGASAAMAASLAQATVAAEQAGKSGVGFAHLLDYLDGLQQGRIQGAALAAISHPTPASIRINAQGGIAQLGFDQAFDALVEKCSNFGMAVLLLHHSFTVGELGYYTRRLAEAGLVALACTNAHAQVTTASSGQRLFGTNPLSFAAPRADGPPLVIDQSSSATAFVNLRRAAEEGHPIPEGWALGPDGQTTTDASLAIQGLLLPFGGQRGANIALMVETLAAGLGGGQWSTDAASFAQGSKSPDIGLFVVAFAPTLLAPDFSARLTQQLSHLAARGLHIPGSRPALSKLDIAETTLQAVRAYAQHRPGP